MAKHKGLTAKKARTILHDKEVRGYPLTAKQRGLFGTIASGKARTWSITFGHVAIHV